MNKRANLYFAALLGAMSPLCTVSALAAQSNSTIATATQQQNSCTGTVKDATGEPIIGATIRIEGKTGGTVTDLDGNFTLSNIEKGTKLTITYVGYKSQTLTWSGSPLNITLQDDANMLEETVVIGYGTVKKADLAGSVAVLDSKNFKDQPVARVEDALNGRMSGVQVMSSGVPGGAMKIRVRGASSVNKSNDPLYVVDGIVRETGLEGISPEDIQSIQVLKDASSTAIYGARGANGVVMVQTKTGKAGATQVTFDASFGFSNAYNVPEVMSTKDYANALVQYKGADSDALADYISGANPGIDWMDQLLHTGITQNYKIAVSKGNEQTQTYFSANYMDQEGVVRDTKSRRYAVKLNIHNKLFDCWHCNTYIIEVILIGNEHGSTNLGVHYVANDIQALCTKGCVAEHVEVPVLVGYRIVPTECEVRI
jgi:TonB-dependent starch-binding outer membrane protein SusC